MRQSENSALVTVTSELKKHTVLPDAILPQTLLKYSRRLTESSYVIQNFHQISEKLPEAENIYILGHDMNDDFPEHRHDYYEICYVCEGEVLNIIDGNEIYMSQGELAIVNPKGRQALRYLGKRSLLLNFCLKKELFSRTLKSFYEDDNPVSAFLRGEIPEGRNYMFFSAQQDGQAQAIISNIIQEYTQAGFRQTYALEAYFILLFTHLTRMGEYSYYGVDKKTLEMIQELKKRGATESIASVARSFGYHPGYFTLYIKKHTGRSCKDIVQESKLLKALDELAHTDYRINDIAADCGYTSASHFYRIFRETYGMTPGEYRRRLL